MKNEMNIICIVCPIGCYLKIKRENNEIKVTGNQCKRGELYAVEEINEPKRVLTSTVMIIDGIINRLPVKTDAPLSKLLIEKTMIELSRIKVKAPIRSGEIIIENIFKTDVNIVATRSIKSI